MGVSLARAAASAIEAERRMARVQAREISEYTAIPGKFLEQVMHDLRQGGLVHSQRGKGGGYVLAVDPATVSFADVIDLIDGSHGGKAVSYTHLRAHETRHDLVCRLLLE